MKRNSKRTVDTAEYKKRRRIRYEIIIQNTGDSKLANKARSWSDDRILRELGYYVPKRIKHHKLVQKPKPIVTPIIPIGKPKRPKKLTKKQVQDQLKRQHYLEAKKRRKAKVKTIRIKMWADWFKKGNDPERDPTFQRLLKTVERVNKIKGEDPHSTVGFTIVYNAFIHQEPVSDWIEKTVFIGFDKEEYVIRQII
jgi:hypothetical protein